MIVRDESLTIERILSSVKQFADEIVIVDTGSKDNTKDICIKFTDKIFDFEWIDDFAAARNYAFSKAKCEYTMWLDADDVIDQDDITKLNQLKQKLSTQDIIMMPYEIAFDEMGKATYSYYRERIVKTGMFKWVGRVHEVLPLSGTIEYCNVPIKHKKLKPTDPKRNLKIYKKIVKSGQPLDARQQFYYANEYYYNNMFKQAIREYTKYLSMDGFRENKIQACLNLARIYIATNNLALAQKSLVDSFVYDLPRPEILCELGYTYLLSKDYRKAIYWYKLALQKYDLTRGGFVEKDKYDYVPLIQISVSYFYLGDIKKAQEYNSRALKVKPNDPLALKNQAIIKNFIVN